MKYLQQAVILAAVTSAAELIKYLLPLPVPASVSVLADLETVRTMLAPLLLAGFLGTTLVMLTAGRTAQRIIRSRRGGRGNE